MQKQILLILMSVVLIFTVSMVYADSHGPDIDYIPTCEGVEATIFGTEGDDILIGTNGDDVMQGRGGNDIIYGFGGDDLLCGNFGDDQIDAGTGNDRIFAGPGYDICYVKVTDFTQRCKQILPIQNPINLPPPVDDMSEEIPSVLLIRGHELVNVQGRAIEQTLVNDSVTVDTSASFDGEKGRVSDVARITIKITDPDMIETTQFASLDNISAGETRTFSSDQIKLTKSGTYTFEITINKGDGDLISGPVTLTVTTPVLTESFTASNLTIRDRDTGDILGDIQTEKIVRIGAIVINDKSNKVTYFYTVDITDPDFGGGVAFNKTIDLATIEDTIFATWSPLKAGTYTITLNIFDNKTDLNPLITPLQLSVVVTGEDKLTFEDLVQKVTELEARIVILEANQ